MARFQARVALRMMVCAQGREAEGAVGQVRWDACSGSSGVVLLWGWELSSPEL